MISIIWCNYLTLQSAVMKSWTDYGLRASCSVIKRVFVVDDFLYESTSCMFSTSPEEGGSHHILSEGTGRNLGEAGEAAPNLQHRESGWVGGSLVPLVLIPCQVNALGLFLHCRGRKKKSSFKILDFACDATGRNFYWTMFLGSVPRLIFHIPHRPALFF